MITEACAHVANIQKTPAIFRADARAAFVTLGLDRN
jgi:hypothetical protein